MHSKFIHLHTHSHYSLLNALPKIDELVHKAKECKMSALALTDNSNLYGAIEFYKACKSAGIKPIIGIDAYVAVRKRTDKQAGVDNRRTRLILLAKNETGYKNLIKLVTLSYLEGFYYKPRIDREIMEKYSEGLIAILPSFSGETTQALKNKDADKAQESIDWHKKIYGAQDFFLEITHHPEIEGHEDLMKKIVHLGKETDTPLVAAHDVYYLNPEDKKARDTLLLVNTATDWGDRNNTDSGAEDFSFITQEKSEEFFSHLPEALHNSVKIADACDLKLELGKWVFPDYKVQSGVSHDDEIKRLAYEGIKLRGLEETDEIKVRIEYELKIIKDKGYSPYFLVVSDLLRHARSQKIFSTTRGSAAGSMVSYLTFITTVNPIEYKIPFERFLNPERPSAPDIDMDIADNRRDEMIRYVKEKYGEDRVAQVGTFGTMMARGSVRDVARALGFPYTTGDRIAKLIPMGAQGFPMTIDKALKEVPELKKIYKEEQDAKTIIDMAKKIEGCARHISVHAAGVVISPKPLTEFTPLQYDTKGDNKIITQYDMYSIEEAGLLKFDFLGIKNLSILADTVSLVKKLEGIEIDIDNIPIDDKKTFEMLALGETAGLFQLNGQGMTRHLKDMKPTTIHDINAMVALYRPGPMQFIPDYIKRKHNPKLIKYLDPALEKILKPTYGILVYQDDLLMMARDLAGYTWGEVDKFRKAVGKKIPAEMEAQKEKFIQGCIEHSKWTLKKATEIWKWIEPFAAYGFNKAHSVSYGRFAYQTAYMKANFPAIYMAAVLTADSGDVEKIGEIIAECKRMGVPVLPPNINESFSDFTVVKGEGKDKIRFGLTTIKNFGEGIAKTIIEEREKNGKFKSLSDLLQRIKDRNLNKKSLEALIKTGALDELGERGAMLANIENLLSYKKEMDKASENQDSLFGGLNDAENNSDFKLEDAEPASQSAKLIWEKELLGLYISGHPLDKYRNVLEKRQQNILKIKEKAKDGEPVVIGGIIEEVKPITTKKGDSMMFLRLADLYGSIEVVVFPRVCAEFRLLLAPEKCVAISGKISERNGEISVLADKVMELK